MSDRNPMLQNNNNPVAGLGIIPGKALLDDETVAMRKKNAKDPRAVMFCYPGGEDNLNHNVMQGDLVFGRRGTRDVESMDGEPNELALASVAGMRWDAYNSQEEMQRDHYFIGVAAGEEKLENPLDANTPDARNGFGTVRVGTISVVNNGTGTFYPGDLVAWKFPDAPFTPKNSRQDNLVGGEDPMRPGINQNARYGDEPTKFRPEIVPFEPTDLSVQLGGVYSAIVANKNDNGVSDVDFTESLPTSHGESGQRALSLLQDEALAYKFGCFGVFAGILEHCVKMGVVDIPNADGNPDVQVANLLERIGLFGTGGMQQGMDTFVPTALANVFMQNIGYENQLRADALKELEANHGGQTAYQIATTTPETAVQKEARLRLHALDILTHGISSSVHAKRSTIIGRAMSASAPGDTTDVLLGHTV